MIATMQVASDADTVMVTAPRLEGEAEAVNVERMSAQIVQVAPEGVIMSLPNTNVADAIGRLPSVSLERDEGEGKYVQIRGTEPRLSNLTINGVNVPSVEVTVRNVKMDAIPSAGIERIEVYKTLASDQDADGVGGTVNLVTPTATDKPTYSVNGMGGYNPIQNGYWLGDLNGDYGRRFGGGKKLGFLLGGSWNHTNRGIDDLEPSQTFGTLANGQNVAFINSEDLRSYQYYRTRYGFVTGLDYKINPGLTAYLKGFYSDFHDFGETRVYTPNAGSLVSASGSTVTFADPTTCPADQQAAGNCSLGNWQYRHYIRRPDQQVFSFQSGVTQTLSKDLINWEFAVSRGHNIGGQDFPTTYFQGPSAVAFAQDNSDPYRPRLYATDGTNGFDPSPYTITQNFNGIYHATQLNIQGGVDLAHNYTAGGRPSTFSLGLKFRNSYSTQREKDTTLNANNTPGPFQLSNVLGSYTNSNYYNKSFAINGLGYGPTSSYNTILNGVSNNAGAFTQDVVTDDTTNAGAFFNADELISAGYLEDVIYLKNLRLEGGVRFDSGATHFLANQVTAVDPCKAQDPNTSCPQPPVVTPNRQSTSYFNALPSIALQWQFHKDTNLRAVYSRGLARPNIGDLVPATTIDPNQTPYPTVSTGNPSLVPTLSDNIDVLVEHYFQPLGIIQGGYFFKELHDPIYPVATLISNFNNTGRTFQLTQSINGPNAHIQGIEFQWEQRFSFLPGLLNGLGMNVNYAYTTSQVTFPAGFDGGRTDHPELDRTAPNNYNINIFYDRNRFSGRFAISYNDANIAAYQWNATTGPISDPILGVHGPTGDNYFYPHTQFDTQGSYRVYKNLQVVGSILNMSNEVFGFYNGNGIYPVQREYYRPSYSFGFRWTMAREQ
ncbi:MAG: TonB-dependent receptor [Acidobacteriaceae bacterium]|nr:TonB-dependent receptor [Acidobacteriaceae bacterium]